MDFGKQTKQSGGYLFCMSDVRTDFLFRRNLSFFIPAAYGIRNLIYFLGFPGELSLLVESKWSAWVLILTVWLCCLGCSTLGHGFVTFNLIP